MLIGESLKRELQQLMVALTWQLKDFPELTWNSSVLKRRIVFSGKCTITSSEQQGIEPTEWEALGAEAGQAEREREIGRCKWRLM